MTITITLSEYHASWFAVAIIIWAALTVVNAGLDVYLWHLQRKFRDKYK